MSQPALPAVELEASLHALHEASFGWARSCCDGDPDDAADVLQSTYVKVLSGDARYGGRSSFKTWLFGVIRLTALEARRRAARELSLAARHEQTADTRPADAHLLEAEERQSLRRALEQLPARQQEVLLLVFYHELSISEAADVMHVSVGSARTHYDRGKKRMRSLLVPDATHEDPAAMGDPS
ncbi:MAG: RNA polymerase sigma factor [Gemmatimonadota bacterium]